MRRAERVKRAYDSSGNISIRNRKYSRKVIDFLTNDYLDDIGRFEELPKNLDVTVEAIFCKQDPIASAYIIAKEDGVIAGLEEARQFYTFKGFKVENYFEDGDEVEEGDKVLGIEGHAKDMLLFERTVLNFMQRMSGIATATKKLKDKIKDYDTAIVSTRKTQLRFFDKRAVALGGGYTHRIGLYDAVMIKDTHIDYLRRESVDNAFGEAIKRVSKYVEDENIKFIEVEVSNLEEAVSAAENLKEIKSRSKLNYYDFNPTNTVECIIMLDNMKPSEIKKVITNLKKNELYDYVLLEASGMINEKNIKQYAATGVDAISIGAITHSVKALDISQKIVKEEK